jgi:hypothetical protein
MLTSADVERFVNAVADFNQTVGRLETLLGSVFALKPDRHLDQPMKELAAAIRTLANKSPDQAHHADLHGQVGTPLPPMNASSLWTIQDAASYFNVTVGAMRAMYRRGQIPEVCVKRIGRRIRFIPAELARWIGLSITFRPKTK